jgi:ribosome-interacting GTPase 1
MATNLTPQYQKAEEAFHQARTSSEKLAALQKMLVLVPKHKATEKLQQQLKQRIAKIRLQEERQRQQRKGGYSIMVKREGAAQIVLVGTTNSGKSTLLRKLTGAKVEIASYPFTTKMPEVGIADYHGVKLQMIEIPALVEGFSATKMGPTFMSFVKQADLMVLLFKTPDEKKLLDKELEDVYVPKLIYNGQEDFVNILWKKLGLIKVYTKQPGKKKEGKPLALHRGATVRAMAKIVHKDFLKRFRFARVSGTSAKFGGQMVGLDHVLADDDVVELHLI